MSQEKKEHAVALAVIFMLTVAFFSPLLRGRTFSMVGAHMVVQYPWRGVVPDLFSSEITGRAYPQTDHAEGLYPTSVFATRAIRSGQLPLWSPYSLSGVPIMETGIGNGLQYPPQLLSMFFLSPIRQHDFLLFSHMLLAGLAMYALLRCWGANVFGAILGAMIWQFNGHNSFFLVFEFVTIAAAWFPLMLLGATLTIRKQSWRWAIATGVAVGMSVLHGIQHFEYFGALVLGGWYGVLTVISATSLYKKGDRRAALRCLLLPAISLVTAAALSAASWLSVVSVLSHIHRLPHMADEIARHRLPYAKIVRILFFPKSAGTGLEALPVDFTSFAFVGVPALILIPAALWRRNGLIYLAIIIGLIGLSMFVAFPPVIGLLRLTVPFFENLRIWDGYYLFCFGMAVLAGFGLSELTKRLEVLTVRKYLIPTLVVPLLIVECLQLFILGWTMNPSHPVADRWLYPETPMVTKLKELQGDFHMIPIYRRDPTGAWTAPAFAGRAPLVFDLRASSGYESLAPRLTAMLWQSIEDGGNFPTRIPPAFRPYYNHDELPLKALENLSVGLLAAPPETEPRDVNKTNPLADGSVQLVYRGQDGLVYQLPNALPRAFLVPAVLSTKDDDEALKLLLNRGFDARDSAIVVGQQTADATGLSSSGGSKLGPTSTAKIISDRVNDVSVDVSTDRPAMLVLNDSWDQGWRVQVNGQDKPLVRVNYNSRGVVVPEGKHSVVFLYRPRLVLIGLSISAVTLLLVLVAGAWLAISRRREWRSLIS